MKKLYILVVVLLGLSTMHAQYSIILDFEALDAGTTISTVGWSTGNTTGTIVTNAPQADGNKVVRVATSNWNSAPVYSFNLPEGVNLSQYSAITFSGFFESGDIGWKDINVQSYGTTQPATHGTPVNNPAGARHGFFNRASGPSTAWETITIPFSGAALATQTGTVWIAVGMHTNIQAGNPAVYYMDNVTLVGPLGPPVSVPSNRVNSDIFVSNGQIIISGSEGQKVEVYSIAGTKVYEAASISSSATIAVPAGIYVVVVDNVPTKVVVK